MVHVTVNKNMTLKKINILEYAFGEGGGGHQKAYAVYAFINVDNCERPLSFRALNATHSATGAVGSLHMVRGNWARDDCN